MLKDKAIQNALRALQYIGLDEAAIDSDAALLLNSATKTVETILKKREDLDRQGRQNEPLIVLAGETHNQPAHYLHHINVLLRLRQKEPTTALSMELPHDSLQKEFSRRALYDLPMAGLTEFFNDKSHQHSGQCEFSFSNYDMAPYSRKTLFHVCMQDDIPLKLVDVSKKSAFLDAGDPTTAQSIKTCLGSTVNNLTTYQAEGAWVRNQHMVTTTQNFAAQTDPRIILQQCGNAHLGGNNALPPSQSLAALYNKAGIPFMGYYLYGQNYYAALRKSSSAFADNNIITIPDLPSHTAKYGDSFMALILGSAPRNKETFQDQETEAAYVNLLLHKTGWGNYAIPETDFNKELLKNRQNMHWKFEQWKRDLSQRPRA